VAKHDDRSYSERTIITERKLPVTGELTDHDAYLVVIYGDELGKRIHFQKERSKQVGRAPARSHRSGSVSRRHARIWWTGDAFRVKDLGSTNGTYVNAVVVGEQDLRDGDLVKVGQTILKFMAGSTSRLRTTKRSIE